MELPDGEPWPSFVRRALTGIAQLDASRGRILVVCHMGVQRVIEHGLGRELQRYGNLEGLWVAPEAVREALRARAASRCIQRHLQHRRP